MSSDKTARAQAKARFTRAKNKLDLAIDNGLLTTTIQSRYTALKQEWENTQLKHEQYVLTLADPSVDEEEWIDLISNEYDESEEKADKFLHEREQKEKVDQTRRQELEREKEAFKRKEMEQSQRLKHLKISRDKEIDKFDLAADSLKSLIGEPVGGRYKLTALVNTVKESKKRLDTQFAACEKVQNEIITAVADEERKKEREHMAAITKIYYHISDESQLFIGKVDKHCEESSTNPSTMSSGIRLEKLKFPPFEGDCRKYPRFKEQFIRHIKPLYNGDQEAFALRSYLSDAVREEIEAFGEDIEAAWDRLDTKYGDEGKMIDLVMNEIKKMSRPLDQNPQSVLEMMTTIEKSYRDLKCLGLENEMRNATIVSIIEERLPDKLKDKWLDVITSDNIDAVSKRDKFPALLDLLTKYRERLEYDMRELRSIEKEHGASHNVTDETKPKPDNNRTYPWCWLHPTHNDHPIWRCEEFAQTPPAERIELMRKHNACFGCLQQGHVQYRCRRNFKCRVDNCGLKHHQLLHDAHTAGITFHNESRKDEGNTVLQIQEVNSKTHNGRNQKLNVMWDDGSTISLITFEKAKSLGLKGQDINLDLDTVGCHTKSLRSKRYKLQLEDEKGQIVEIIVQGIEKISRHMPQIDIKEALKEFKLPSSASLSQANGKIDCLIGFEYAGYHPVKVEAKRHLLLLRNRFGTIIAGHQTKEGSEQSTITQGAIHHAASLITDYFAIEQLGTQCQPQCGGCKCGKCHPGGKNMTIREEKELKLIEDNLDYDQEYSQWQASYPWIKDPNQLPDNKIAAIGSLKSLEKRLKRDERRATIYQEQIKDMIDRKVCRKLDAKEINEYDGPVFYLPHHDVVKKKSESTPCRIVFNSSASFHGHSLNKYLAKGPDLINSLLGVLMRFREERVAFIGDIRKMFHSITIPLRDQMTHRFLWRDLDESKNPDTYAITRVNFGDRPSGTIAIAALRKTADMSETEYPEASQTIKSNSYVDDILDSVKSYEKANSLTSEISTVLATGSFFIKEWHISKNNSVEKRSQMSDVKPKIVNKNERVLGMIWNPDEDILSFKATPFTEDDTLTKRKILSKVNGIYDPLGLAGPFTVRSKIMLRKLWSLEQRFDWDDPVPEELDEEWKLFFKETSDLNNVQFNRCTKPEAAVGEPSLIIFSDASQDVYGAAAYVRWQVESGNFESRLMLSKNRIAPMKTINIVRLELAGAVISKRLRTSIEEESRYSFSEIYHIVDSEVVKAMIGKESYGFNTYVANRLGEIQTNTHESEWYWIAREHNISDWITHGKSPDEIGIMSEWQRGPKFLSQPKSEWPIFSKTSITELPERIRFIGAIADKDIETLTNRIEVSRFSSFDKLIRVTAKVLWLYHKFKKANMPNDKSLLEKAEKLWIVEAQKELHEKLTKGELIKLCPRTEDDVIIVGGRAERWMEATWNAQAFILLPHNHPISKLIVLKYHNIGHLGVSATGAKIRSKY